MPHPAESDLPSPASYDTNQSDVVIDNITGLMWEREASASQPYEDAASYCGELVLGGFCDWRLPTRIELVSLVDFTSASPAMDGAFSNDAEISFSFSSSVAEREGLRWSLAYTDGATMSQGGERSARCVRTHQADKEPETRYVFEGQDEQETVTDLGTGLVWQRRGGQETYSFADAPAYCATVNLPGEGWRVPSMKELQTIVDETQIEASVLVDAQVFPDVSTAQSHFWTSTLDISHDESAWFVRFDTGRAIPLSRQITYDINSELHVRCVR